MQTNIALWGKCICSLHYIKVNYPYYSNIIFIISGVRIPGFNSPFIL